MYDVIELKSWIIGECVLPNLFNFPQVPLMANRKWKRKRTEAIFSQNIIYDIIPSYYAHKKYYNYKYNRPRDVHKHLVCTLLVTTNYRVYIYGIYRAVAVHYNIILYNTIFFIVFFASTLLTELLYQRNIVWNTLLYTTLQCETIKKKKKTENVLIEMMSTIMYIIL